MIAVGASMLPIGFVVSPTLLDTAYPMLAASTSISGNDQLVNGLAACAFVGICVTQAAAPVMVGFARSHTTPGRNLIQVRASYLA